MSFENDSTGNINEGIVTPVALNRMRAGVVSSDQKQRLPNGVMSGNGKPINAQRDSCPNLETGKYDSIQLTAGKVYNALEHPSSSQGATNTRPGSPPD